MACSGFKPRASKTVSRKRNDDEYSISRCIPSNVCIKIHNTFMSLNKMSAIVDGFNSYICTKSDASKLMRSRVFSIEVRQAIISSNILRKFSRSANLEGLGFKPHKTYKY